LVSAKLAHEAFDGLIAAVEPALGHQTVDDNLAIWFFFSPAGTRFGRSSLAKPNDANRMIVECAASGRIVGKPETIGVFGNIATSPTPWQ
jgi:hypothetical protein